MHTCMLRTGNCASIGISLQCRSIPTVDDDHAVEGRALSSDTEEHWTVRSRLEVLVVDEVSLLEGFRVAPVKVVQTLCQPVGDCE